MKCHVLSFIQFSYKVGNPNKPAPHMEAPFHKMGDITHVLDDVTRFSPIEKTDRDWYTELGPNRVDYAAHIFMFFRIKFLAPVFYFYFLFFLFFDKGSILSCDGQLLHHRFFDGLVIF